MESNWISETQVEVRGDYGSGTLSRLGDNRLEFEGEALCGRVFFPVLVEEQCVITIDGSLHECEAEERDCLVQQFLDELGWEPL